MSLNIKTIGIILAVLILTGGMFATPVAAESDDTDDDTPDVDLCEDADDAQDTIQVIFIILSGLGPLFGTLFYVGLTVAESASIDKNYGDKRRKVIIAGFSVPIAIAFLGVVADELVRGADISCFFP